MKLQIKQIPSPELFITWQQPSKSEIHAAILQDDGAGILHYAIKPLKTYYDSVISSFRDSQDWTVLLPLMSEIIRREAACGVDGVMIVTGHVMTGHTLHSQNTGESYNEYIPILIKVGFQNHKVIRRIF